MAVDAQELARLQRENAALRHGIPPELLADVPAAELEARATALVQWRGQPAQPPAQQPGVPVPGDNAARAAESEEQRRLREMRHKVRQRPGRSPGKNRTLVEPWEAEEFRDLAFKTSWNAHMEHRRTGRGNVSEPPRGVPLAPALAPMGASF